MIPKIIHYVWVGDKEKPEFVLKCIESWKKYCPDYEIIEWDNEKFEKIKNEYSQQAFENKKWAFVSDYIRLYALYNYGGVYLDTDVEITQNIDKFLLNEFFSGFEVYENIYSPILSAVMGAAQESPIIEDLLEYYRTNSFITKNGYDVTPNTKRITQYFETNFNIHPPYDGEKTLKLKDGCIIYPYYYFCQKKEAHENYAIHHYKGSWLDRYKRQNLFSLGKYTFTVFKEINKNSKSLPVSSKESFLKTYRLNSQKSLVIIEKHLNKKQTKNLQEKSAENNPLISIIIPVYNVEKYLADCLISVINQTYKNLEIICVNDGSTDGSTDILKKYQQKDSRIKVITQQNKGLAAARNTALNNISGKYFFYVDSDDYIHPQTIEILYNSIRTNPVDLVVCDFEKTTKKYSDNDFTHFIDLFPKTKIIKNPLEQYAQLRTKISPSVWTNLYSTNKYGNIRFVEGYVWEDVYYTLQCLDRAGKIGYLNLKLYGYMQNPLSISLHTYSAYKIDCHIKNIMLIHQYFENRDKPSQQIKEKLIAKFVRRLMNDVENSGDKELKIYLSQKLKELKKQKLISFKFLKLSKWVTLWSYLR